MKKTMRVELFGESEIVVVVKSRIIQLSKSKDQRITYIHLDNGELLNSCESMKTLEARLNLED